MTTAGVSHGLWCLLVVDRALYRQFVDEVIIKPGTRHIESNRTDVTLDDHVCTVMTVYVLSTIKGVLMIKTRTHTHTHTPISYFRDYPGKLVPER